MERDQEKEDSVYDFLYIDNRRLAHFLSQFSQYGHLTSLTRSANETSSSSGSLNVHIAKMDSASKAETSQTRQFDTQWMAPLSFLDEANQRGMIFRGLDQAHIGRLSLVTGSLALFNLAVVQSTWGISQVKNIMSAAIMQDAAQYSNRNERREQERTRIKEARAHADLALEILKFLPHAILATIQVGPQFVWSSLREDGMMVSASDLMLKHGVRIAGMWNMIGVIDALPDDESEESNDFLPDVAAATSLGSLGPVVGTMGPAVRGLLGRPKEAFGMTPLLIFREVSG